MALWGAKDSAFATEASSDEDGSDVPKVERRAESKGASSGHQPSPLALPGPASVDLFGPSSFWEPLGGPPILREGAWVEYELREPHRNPSQVRISVVPEADLPSPQHRVLELRSIEPTGDRNYVKMLLSVSSDQKQSIEAVQVKQANLPPLTLPMAGPSAPKEMRIADAQPETATTSIRELGTRTVETPAGSFECRCVSMRVPSESEDGEDEMEVCLDSSGRVPLWRFVSTQSDARGEAVLLGFGNDARADMPPIGPAVR